MQSRNVDILCIQETHLNGAEYYDIDGFMVCLSGDQSDSRSHSGVGFIVSPLARRSVVSFQAVNDRLASLKVKVPGGTLSIISAYAPHSGHPFALRHDFFAQLSMLVKPLGNHSGTVALGDFNAKLGRVMDGEGEFIGPCVYQCELTADNDVMSNRALLVECCVATGLLVAKPFFDVPDENKVSYRGLSTKPLDNIDEGNFSQIDHVLWPKGRVRRAAAAA